MSATEDGGEVRASDGFDLGGDLLGVGGDSTGGFGIEAANGAGILFGDVSQGIHANLGGLDAGATIGSGFSFGQQSDGDLAAAADTGTDFNLGFIEGRFGTQGNVEVGESGGNIGGSVDLGFSRVGAGASIGGGDAGVSFSLGSAGDSDPDSTVVISDETVEDVTEDVVGAVLGDEAGEAAGDTVDAVGDFFFGSD